MRATYSFTADWTLPAPVERVATVLVDLERYPEWWPQVRAVASLGPDTARVLCRSTLPYTLDLVLEAVSREPPLLEVRLGGDLEGRVRWQLEPAGPAGTRMRFAQDVEVGGPLALASYAARPLLAWNHARMMAGCRAGLSRRTA
ncbi:MAG: SRPBCC family protein [Nocardioidaceae bacterium]|nr:SRPBCC family protein [Nocardioidaceae bacterium]MCL2614062.1 SRPBCC family protein [Nocardioidaceae bacterium]